MKFNSLRCRSAIAGGVRAAPKRVCAMMVESSGHARSIMAAPSTSGSSSGASSAASSTHMSAARCGVLETRVRGAWYRVTVMLESDYLSVSLDETCDPVDHSTTLNGTLG